MPDQKMDDLEIIFSAILVVANRMDTMLERTLGRHNVTAKQWFLLNALNRWFDAPPTMMELAREMGSSHQNVKQVALKLQEKELLTLTRDKRDARILRLHLTEKSREFWAESSLDCMAFMEEFYKDIDKNDIGRMCATVAKMMGNLNRIEKDSGAD
jgi:DNA-binding MarR family transcriptional regulator